MTYIGIIGGSGLYQLMDSPRSIDVDTPFGRPSSSIDIGTINGVEVAFIARHGKKHSIPPHRVNYRANIWALNSVGVKRIIGINAVGSLKEEMRPGDVVIPDQFIDFTKRRDSTFYDGPSVYHISTADPFCPDVNSALASQARAMGKRVHDSGTYVVIEGPRFSTRAESKMFRQFGDIIGMTLVPEVVLADEMAMCYSVLATVTDYDVWSEKPVDTSEVLRVMKENEDVVREVVRETVPRISGERKCNCSSRLENAKA